MPRVLKSAAHCERRSQKCERERDRRSKKNLTSASASAAQKIDERWHWAPLADLIFLKFNLVQKNFAQVEKFLQKEEKVSTKSRNSF